MTYGFQFFDSAGNPYFESDETFARRQSSHDLGGSASGTLSIPGFDSTRGFAYVALDGTNTGYNTHITAPPIGLPNVSWDNTAKELTYSGNGTSNEPDYTFVCLHFK